MPSFMRTYCQRGYVSRRGCQRLNRVLAECADFYNSELELWRRQYEETGSSDSLFDRMKAFTRKRHDDGFWSGVSVIVGRGVLCRMDRARKAFYRRTKNGEKPGYPRFKPRNRYRTIQLEQAAPGMIKPDKRGYVIRIKQLSRLSNAERWGPEGVRGRLGEVRFATPTSTDPSVWRDA